MKRPRGKPGYASITATLALFLALGGVSYAAVTLPKNSVGSRQLKARAVTASKLSASATAALTGPAGPRGATGQTGAAGPAGAKGDPGTPATSLLAHISEEGTLVDGSGVTGAERVEKAYAIDFVRDISNCNLQTTFDRSSSTVGTAPASPDEQDPQRVIVETRDASGKNSAHGFYLAVLCP